MVNTEVVIGFETLGPLFLQCHAQGFVRHVVKTELAVKGMAALPLILMAPGLGQTLCRCLMANLKEQEFLRRIWEEGGKWHFLMECFFIK